MICNPYTTYTGTFSELPAYNTIVLKKKNVLIIGGLGLIGSAIREHLKKKYTVHYHDIRQAYRNILNQKYYAVIDCGRYETTVEQRSLWTRVIYEFEKQGHGNLILFSSIYGHKAPRFEIYGGTEVQPTPLDYAMDKAAVEQATRYLAKKLEISNIKVNCIAPGGVLNGHSEGFQFMYRMSGNAPMIGTKNLLPVVDMLLHEDSAVNGEVITVDGGWCL